MSTTSNARLRAALLLLLVAGLGFATGIIADRLLFAPTGLAAESGAGGAREGITILLRDPDAPAGRRMVVLSEWMAAELGLTAEQQAAIERIVADDQTELRELAAEVQPAFAEVIERSRRRIEVVLTEEQRERWRAMPQRRLRVGGPGAPGMLAPPPGEARSPGGN